MQELKYNILSSLKSKLINQIGDKSTKKRIVECQGERMVRR